ncbi:hypothetical protein GCM10009122_13860 [Fulvivirga kasyanovii]|uniref:Type II toxin-antitoxin system RelE/ParE family toxin n=1 Tax=Fulvivirga kasyanovii TaxID=396812 RepID=A0ABW9RVZ5_9BACT|nr:type II toxin-antitoxin system RelE/ParE family toxin [Fulvivirga kasyanovii]MTI27408.1 type II toxin-antitoxin system RelE/ParE family toxin [Fulvivirga kasyanovii]
MIVELTDLAEEGLREIHCHFPKSQAQKLVDKILDRAATLSTLANRGHIVEELRNLNQGHRFVLEGDYKIIYLQEGETVYVIDIFNMGKHPENIRKRYLSR